jgi:hypothetical protein
MADILKGQINTAYKDIACLLFFGAFRTKISKMRLLALP